MLSSMYLAIVLASSAQKPSPNQASPIGINLDVNNDSASARAWVNVTNLCRRWGMPDKPWLDNTSLELTADGYPLRDAGTLTYLEGYPDGVYHLSYEGSGEITVKGMGRLDGPISRKGKVRSGKIVVDHAKGSLLLIKVTGVDRKNPIHNLRILCPGYPPDTQEIFTETFLRRLRPFSVIRFMDWAGTNNSLVKEWSDRVPPETFLKTGPGGVAWEDMITLSNVLKKDAWINIPDQASDDYVRELARLFRRDFHPGGHLYVEFSNEVWNFQFRQAHRNRDAAKVNPQFTKTDDFGRAAESAAARLVKIGQIFREEFVARSSEIIPVLGGFIASRYYAETGLNYIKSKYGDPKKFVSAIAIAPYLNIDAKAETVGMTRDELFKEMNRFLNKEVLNFIRQHRDLAKQWGIPLVAYEGGQHLVAFNAVAKAEINLTMKGEAQNDRRMGELYEQFFTIWNREGGGLFMHFANIKKPGKFGFWGLLETANQPGSPKWDAVISRLVPMGDATLDGIVDSEDFQVWKRNRENSSSPKFWEQGDFNHDGKVDVRDLDLMRSKFSRLTPALQNEVEKARRSGPPSG